MSKFMAEFVLLETKRQHVRKPTQADKLNDLKCRLNDSKRLEIWNRIVNKFSPSRNRAPNTITSTRAGMNIVGYLSESGHFYWCVHCKFLSSPVISTHVDQEEGRPSMRPTTEDNSDRQMSSSVPQT